MKESHENKLTVSESAYQYLRGKNRFFASRARYARIILNGIKCTGASFSLFHDYVADSDMRLDYKELTLIVEPDLIQRFGGFDLDTERFFFGTRILIQPRVNDYNCDCDQKCNSAH